MRNLYLTIGLLALFAASCKDDPDPSSDAGPDSDGDMETEDATVDADEEVMPDALAPASPRPEMVLDVLSFLFQELEARRTGEPEDGDGPRVAAEIVMTETLVDLVMGLLYGLSAEEMERVGAARKGG